MSTVIQEQAQDPQIPAEDPSDTTRPPGGRRTAVLALAGIIAGCVGLSVLFVAVGRDGAPSAPPGAPAGAVAAPGAAPATGPVTVDLTEFTVKAAATTIAPGQVTLTITNAGKIQHELLVFRSDLAPGAYPKADGGIDEEGAGIQKVSDGDNLDPGTTQTRTVDLTSPGTYLFVCNLPGHYAAGMYQVVTVK
ncbi:MAG TPA: plastocyanin/azurin family copper-binding protein [Actinomycetota bacterium]|nr:plastocyanin/azurin family copper-binding protein [Actinomycetota bacterium]